MGWAVPLSEMPVGAFAALPDPAQATGIDDLVERLRLLKVWAGDPSYETIKDRVNAAWTGAGRPASERTIRSTVANCFQPGRRRLNNDLVIAVVEALHPDTGYVARWLQALRVVGGETEAVSLVRVQASLPQELTGFIGRTGELNQLSDALRRAAETGEAMVISAIEGMAGVGKTQLAVHAGHRLLRENAFDRVLFVNLRGFHPDATQPPVDPGAVLDGFLRLLGMPGQQIPHDLAARAAAYRDRLAGTRTLIVLDNAATADQVRPLLPGTAGCLTLITSRRDLAGLQPGIRLAIDVFSPDEAATFLTRSIPGNADPGAIARIARRCGYLPLALSLIAGHIRNTPGWTLADHADRLDERHHERRLDSGVELALNLSYQHLPSDQQRLFRLAALHPGQDFDAYAAAALADTDPATARDWLAHLRRDHLLLQATADRYTFHDLVRAYATGRAHDEDPPTERRAALTRLFDHYLAAAATVMETLHPDEAYRRLPIPPAATPVPDLTDSETARAWLDAERPNLVAVAAYTATQGWPSHTIHLGYALFRHLQGGYHTDALTVHGHALQAALDTDDLPGQAYALTDLGFAHMQQSRPGPAAEHFRRALDLFRQIDEPAGQARALYNLGVVAEQSGRRPAGIDYKQQALVLHRQAGDRTGAARTLSGLGISMVRSGRFPEAVDYYQQALALARQTGNRNSEAFALHGLGEVEVQSGRYEPAGEHLRQTLTLYRQLGNRGSEAGVLDSLGLLHTRLGRPDQATECYRRALTIFREIGVRAGEAWALNGLGEAAQLAGRPADALGHHIAARTIATDLAARDQQARAHAGLGDAHATLGKHTEARGHYHHALTLYADLGVPEADVIRARLAELDDLDE
jgi:tetratricopeptide (TPR) repeat protein